LAERLPSRSRGSAEAAIETQRLALDLTDVHPLRGGQQILALQPAQVVDHQPCLGDLDSPLRLQILDRGDDRVPLCGHRVL
jgi:hypothetical protein